MNTATSNKEGRCGTVLRFPKEVYASLDPLTKFLGETLKKHGYLEIEEENPPDQGNPGRSEGKAALPAERRRPA